MSAWGGNSSKESRKSRTSFSSLPKESWRSLLGFKDQGDAWNPLKKSLFNDQSTPEFISFSGARTISVPDNASGATLELESIPMDDPFPAGAPLWNRPQEDTGLTRQFSENTDTLETSAPVASEVARESGYNVDFSEPGGVSEPSKVEFSSADSARVHSDSSYGSGDLPGAEDAVTLPPTGPISEIASPEPSVTALLGVSALFFVCRRTLRPKSQS
jgi:hypothetical protein